MGPGEPPKSENVNTQYIQKVTWNSKKIAHRKQASVDFLKNEPLDSYATRGVHQGDHPSKHITSIAKSLLQFLRKWRLAISPKTCSDITLENCMQNGVTVSYLEVGRNIQKINMVLQLFFCMVWAQAFWWSKSLYIHLFTCWFPAGGNAYVVRLRTCSLPC